MKRRLWRLVGVSAWVAAWSSAGSAHESWVFDANTSGEDVQWQSPSSLDPNTMFFSGDYDILVVEVDVVWNNINFNNLDVTSLVPADQRTGQLTTSGPAPFEIFDDTLVFPEPPDAPAFSADVVIGVDSGGFGIVEATSVTLGRLEVDLGAFGVQTATLLNVRFFGTLAVAERWLDLGGAAAGTYGNPVLVGSGSLEAGQPMGLSLSNALENTLAALFVGFGELNAPFQGGVLVSTIDLVLFLPTNANGELDLASNWPANVPHDSEIFFQYWMFDAGAATGDLSGSNAVRAFTP